MIELNRIKSNSKLDPEPDTVLIGSISGLDCQYKKIKDRKTNKKEIDLQAAEI